MKGTNRRSRHKEYLDIDDCEQDAAHEEDTHQHQQQQQLPSVRRGLHIGRVEPGKLSTGLREISQCLEKA